MINDNLRQGQVDHGKDILEGDKYNGTINNSSLSIQHHHPTE